MNVPIWVWAGTIGGLLVLFGMDVFIVDVRPHSVTAREAGTWVAYYAGTACVFGLGLWLALGGRYGGEFLAGYVTEYVLSVDTLFTVAVIMATFRVPQIHVHRVLSFGVLGILVLRGGFVAAGALLLPAAEWILYVFGLFLVFTGVSWSLRPPTRQRRYDENLLLRRARRLVPMTAEYHGARTVVRLDGRRYSTPMLMVTLAIASTNVLFAAASVSAIYSLSSDAFLVFSANGFALLGLRPLYFFIEILLRRLVYLGQGLAVLLGFIGVKLILDAAADLGIHWAPRYPMGAYLGVVVGTLVVTVVASLVRVRRTPEIAP